VNAGANVECAGQGPEPAAGGLAGDDEMAALAPAVAGAAERTIVAFCCRECAYAAADAAANARTPLPPSVRLVLVPCTGRVSPLHLVTALAEGADGAMVAGCLLGQCHYREGNFNAVDRVAFTSRLLESVGVEPERVRMFTMSAGEPPRFVAAVREMDRVIASLPPLRRDTRPRDGEPDEAMKRA
jgi:F420-non-reducing hydrogenase iron-sulfur subunit